MEEENEYIQINEGNKLEEEIKDEKPDIIPEINKYHNYNMEKKFDASVYACFGVSDRIAFRWKRLFNRIKKETAVGLINNVRNTRPARDLNTYAEHALCMKILKVSLLEFQMYLNHPFVETHVVNLQTGEYLEAREVCLSGSLNNINEDSPNLKKMNYKTRSFDLLFNKSATAEWKEPINIILKDNEDLSSDILILFEIWNKQICDNDKEDAKEQQKDAPVRIAWGYLVPFGVYQTRTGMIDIQLYKYKFKKEKFKEQERFNSVPLVYFDFLWLDRVKYDTSLSIELTYKPNAELEKEMKSMVAGDGQYDIESDSKNLQDNKLRIEKDLENRNKELQVMFLNKIRLKDYEGSKLPNKLHLSLATDVLGSTIVRFSTSGRYIAYSAVKKDKLSYIRVYDFEENRHLIDLYNHNDVINDLDWHQTDSYLLSSSNDGTVKLFSVLESNDLPPVDINKLRSFIVIEIVEKCAVCSSKFFYTDNNGCFVVISTFDGRVLLFVMNISNKTYKKLIEIDINTQAESVYANTILTLDSTIIIGDSIGRLGFFKYYIENDKLKVEKEKEVSIREIKGSVINSIYYIKEQDYILVQTRDNLIRLINLKNKKIVNRYLHGNFSNCNIRFCVSPDNQFIVSGSEQAKLKVWDYYCADFKEFDLESEIDGIVLSVDWNPTYNAMAVASFGSNFNIKVFVSA